ncbi:MAG: hypothetical protein ACM31L_16045 [Actinomycetota bacterium]
MDFSPQTIERKWAKDAEGLLGRLLARESELDIARWEDLLNHGLHSVAIDFGATTSARRQNLARDLAACWRLYEGLRAHLTTTKMTTSEGRAIAELIEFGATLNKSIRALERADAHFQDLPGLLALEFVVEALRERPAASTGERAGVRALTTVVTDLLADAKFELVLGTPRRKLVTDITARIAEKLEDWTEEAVMNGETVPEKAPMHGFKGIAYGPIMAARAVVDFDRSESSKDFLASSVSWLETKGREWKSRPRRLKLASLPNFSFAWAMCNLVHGWRPRSTAANRLVTISGRKNSYFPNLLSSVASAVSAEPSDKALFSNAAARVKPLYEDIRENWQSVFHGRDGLQEPWRPGPPVGSPEWLAENYDRLVGDADYGVDEQEYDPFEEAVEG